MALYLKPWIFCDSALLAQHNPFEFHGEAPDHALHSAPYQKYKQEATYQSAYQANDDRWAVGGKKSLGEG
jgi:hypothetical protein